jgi:LuxR family maltose regulon positive regulatory protein
MRPSYRLYDAAVSSLPKVPGGVRGIGKVSYLEAVQGPDMTLKIAELPFITKVLVPKQRDYIVSRHRLLDPMFARVTGKAQVVYAPAGYGKTALLVEFAAGAGLPVCWHSFTQEDHDPASFIRYCLHSIRTESSGFGADYPSLARSTVDTDWKTQIGLFISALHTDILGRMVFVFDDLHWIHGKQELEEAVSLLVERSPTNIHFVLGSRMWPSLACLPRLAADNELGWFDSTDLRFSAEETVDLLTNLRKEPTTAEEGGLVSERTGGWAAAIVLSAKGATAPIQTGAAKRENESVLFNYLSEEVFGRLPTNLQSFLMKTSIFKEFTLPLCERILDIDSAAGFINDIKERGLLLEERAGEIATYAYHDLFREYLEQRFRFEYKTQFESLNQRAAAVYLELGDDDATIQHSLCGGEPEKAIEIVKRIAQLYFDQGRWQKLASWLTGLPHVAVQNDPALTLLNGQVLLRVGDPTGSLDELERLANGPHGKDPEILGKALVAKSPAYRRLGHLDLAVRTAQDGLSVLQGTACSKEHVAQAYKQLGNAARGEYALAEENLRTGLAMISKENLHLFSLICNDLGVTCLELGQLDQAAMYLDQARVGLSKLESHGQLAEVLTNLTLVYYQRGEFDLALDEISDALRTAQAGGYSRIVATALMNQSIVQRALGAYRDSLSSASQALEISRQNLDQRLIAESTNALGNAYRKLGEISKAEVLLNQAVLEAEDSGQKYIAACYHISLGKVYYQQGADDSSLHHLMVAEQHLAELKSSRREAEAKLHEAAVYYRTGRLNEVTDSLSKVAELVTQIGYDGFLLADGEEVLDVLRFGSAKRIGDETFTRLVSRLANNGAVVEKTGSADGQSNEYIHFPTLRVFGFGNPRVMIDAHEVVDGEWRSRKAKELFFFLLSSKGHVNNEEIMEALWPETSLDLSGSTLKTNIYRLRQALFYGCMSGGSSGYSLNPEVTVEFDAEEFRENIRLGNIPGNPEAQEEYLLKALELYQGPFLQGFYAEWCQSLRTDLELKYHTALLILASHRAAKGNFLQSAELLEKVIAADPFNEEAQYQLIESYLMAKEPFMALERLRAYAKVSRDELGMDLSRTFIDVQNRIISLLQSSLTPTS